MSSELFNPRLLGPAALVKSEIEKKNKECTRTGPTVTDPAESQTAFEVAD